MRLFLSKPRNLLSSALIFSLLITFFIWLGVADNSIRLTSDFSYSLGKIAGFVAIITLSWNMVLSSKHSLVDRISGGLDKAYKLHRITGILAFVAMMVHPLLLVANYLPDLGQAIKFVGWSGYWPQNFGIIAAQLFTLLIVLTLLVKMPYHRWYMTHKLMSVPYVIAIAHVLLISSDLKNSTVLQVWILAHLGLALASVMYRQFYYSFFEPKPKYKVDTIKQQGQILEISLSCVTDKKLAYSPGQFTFLKVNGNKDILPESHPFTLSLAGDGSLLRFSIKQLGDFTHSLGNLKTGDRVEVSKAFGGFGHKAMNSDLQQLWVAGGIGVTPFLALASSSQIKLQKVFMVYVVAEKKQAVYDKELISAKNWEDYQLYYSQNQGRLTVDYLAKIVPNLADRLIMLCGPRQMNYILATNLIKMGVQQSNIIYEDFYWK